MKEKRKASSMYVLKRLLVYMVKNYKFSFLVVVVCIVIGAFATMQGMLFANMESLPIKYFDTHAHGDIMSVYTNDVDTLRQLFSQSIPQIINSAATLVATFISMIVLNIPLTIVTLVMALVMLRVTTVFSGLSGKYFQKQQRDLGNVDGFIEEMMDGQKVVKVFCHCKGEPGRLSDGAHRR